MLSCLSNMPYPGYFAAYQGVRAGAAPPGSVLLRKVLNMSYTSISVHHNLNTKRPERLLIT